MLYSGEHNNGKRSQVETMNNNNNNSNRSDSSGRSKNASDEPDRQLISDAMTTTTKLESQMKAETKVRANQTTTITATTTANKIPTNNMEKVLRESLAASHDDVLEHSKSIVTGNESKSNNNDNNHFPAINNTTELQLHTSKKEAEEKSTLIDTQDEGDYGDGEGGGGRDDGGGGGGRCVGGDSGKRPKSAAISELKLLNASITEATTTSSSTTKTTPSTSTSPQVPLKDVPQQQQQVSNTESATTPLNVYQSPIAIDSATTLSMPAANFVTDLRFGCAHYKRRAMFVTPCCNKFYKCRFCHDENESHHFDRKTLTELICSECNRRQKVQEQCEACGTRFGKYTCLICNLFDDTDKQQYHCNGCGICRIGGAENFFHCEVCDMCLPIRLKIDGHRCVENISRSHCPVCLGDIHTSRIPCHIPDCGHLLHKTCFDQLLNSGHYTCPICQTSLIDMTALWDYLDAHAVSLPVPKKYENQRIQIFCNDCHKTSKTKFNLIGLKCLQCGAYNTTQDVKRRMSLVTDEPSSA